MVEAKPIEISGRLVLDDFKKSLRWFDARKQRYVHLLILALVVAAAVVMYIRVLRAPSGSHGRR